MKEIIPVTKPYLPALKDFIPYLESIWESKIISNGGPYHFELERALADFLDVKYVSLFTNGTIALETAIRALEVTGDVITTPYSFVATSHAIKLMGLNPIFVDVEEGGFNIDYRKIEEAITPNTSAILPVHCYGFPCENDKIIEIAKKHNLKVIYDAAHAFHVKEDGQSILNYGDLSILSFHATKVFNTFEGGAIICHTEEMKRKIDLLKNFGFHDETTVSQIGTNGKMSEINAAFGLLQLKHITNAIEKRKQVYNAYCELLKDIVGIEFFEVKENITHNYSYFPILVNDKFSLSRDQLYFALRDFNIYSRRYFYPLISELSIYKNLETSNPIKLFNSGVLSK
ncbi:DegT/DnrJ/EryC1/StrS family aminotransferase, partial [Escherichia coli]|nr:DegT/DnrJ/EryC1/StrS family aminotransferase [Escherichia coli]